MEIGSLATAATIGLGPAQAFRLGIWVCDRRADALLAVVQSFCTEVEIYHRLNADGESTVEETRELAGVVRERLVVNGHRDCSFGPLFHPRNSVDTLIEISTDTM